MGSLFGRCIEAGERAAAACEMVLASDDAYTNPGTDPYSTAHLALVSCAATCSLLVRALQEGDGDLELVRWCGEICCQCATADAPEGVSEPVWTLLVHACTRCASACEWVAESISSFAGQACGGRCDTDFQVIAES